MKKIRTTVLIFILAIVSIFSFSACSFSFSENVRSIISIEKNSCEGLKDIYLITYSDGTTSTFTVTNGADGENGEQGKTGETGEKGVGISDAIVNVDGELVITLTDGSEKNCGIVVGKDGENSLGISNIEINQSGELVVTMDNGTVKNPGKIVGEDGKDGKDGKDGEESATREKDFSKLTNGLMLSTFMIYSEYTKTENQEKKIALSGGSGVLYKIDGDDAYIITNYHVVNNSDANEDCKDGFARRVVCYLFGSIVNVGKNGLIGEDGYEEIEYLGQPIECSILGASPISDIAILKADANELKSMNSGIKEIEFADTYHLGETAIAIGNIEGEGISVTQGVVSVIGETVPLSVGGQKRDFIELRIDTSIYQGSSGGGLFNSEGKLIGITNAGNLEKQNINYAIPCDLVKIAVEGIMEYCDGINLNAKKILFGVTSSIEKSMFIFNEETGYGEIVEDIRVISCIDESIVDKLGLREGDLIVGIKVNGNEKRILRQYQLGFLTQSLKEGDTISIKVIRDEEEMFTGSYTIQSTDLLDIT